MNPKFLELSDEKRQKIINAGFEVFAKNDYKHASTEEIAVKGGISKGLLFYYFHDKKTFYTFLFEQAVTWVKTYVEDEKLRGIDDFFELCAYAAERKYRLLSESPYIMDFIVRAFCAQRETLPESIQQKFLENTEDIYGTYFQNLDFSRFRDDVDPTEILEMLKWMVEGYIQERRQNGFAIDLKDLMEKFAHWSGYLKRISYKGEYLS
jgi:AcrR family transcriptional regulator